MGLRPTQRTLAVLRDRGMEVAIVEKWNAHVGPHGIRQDLFGIIDILALDGINGIIGVQSCGQAFSEHHKKLTEERAQQTIAWLSTKGCRLELWGWRKVKLKRGGKAVRWRPRMRTYFLDDDGEIAWASE